MNLIEPQPPAAGRLMRRAGVVPTAAVIWLIGIPPCPRVAPSAVCHASWRESGVSGGGACLGSAMPWEFPMYKTSDARWPLRPAREKLGAAIEQNPPTRAATPRRPDDRRGNWRLAPSTALGEGSTGRSIGESGPAHARLPAPAFAAHGLDGATEIRRSVPTPSPFHSPPPPLHRPGEIGRAVLSPKVPETRMDPPYISVNTGRAGIPCQR